MQNLLVALIVLACAVYAVWALFPMGWRRALAKRLANAPWPTPIKRQLRQASQAGTACACHGCDRGAPSAKLATGEARPIHFHPRRPH